MTSGPGPAEGPRSDESEDAALGGAVRLLQPRKGFRFSVDAVLLARFAAERPVGRAIDLGCGCGVVGLCLLALGGAETVVGVDLQPAMVDRATRSARRSGFGERARFLEGDVRTLRHLVSPRSHQLVVSNPPYRPLSCGRVSPDPALALARHEVSCTVADVAAAAAWLLEPAGELCVVYPAARLPVLLAACRDQGLEPKELWAVHPEPARPAGLVLVRAAKGGKEGLTVRPPLFLHSRTAKYSDEAQALLGPP